MLKCNSSRVPKSDNFLSSKAGELLKMLNKSFLTTLVLQHFDVQRHIQVETDALKYAIDGILSQQNKERHWPLIDFYSQKMITAK